MNATDAPPILTQARVLWWMFNTGEEPRWFDGRAQWTEARHSTLCPWGLGAPYLPHTAVASLLKSGFVTVVSTPPDPKVLVFQGSGTPADRAMPRLALTEIGRRAAPASIPYPWRPAASGMADVTPDEFARLRKISDRPTHAPVKVIDPPDVSAVEDRSNVVPLKSRR